MVWEQIIMVNRSGLHQLKKKLKLVEKHVFAVTIPLQRYVVDNAVSGEETIATYDLYDAWRNYSYHTNKVLFRMNQGILALEKVYDWVDNHISCMEIKAGSSQISIPCNSDACVVGYECEDMIIAFSRLYDQGYIQDMSKYIGDKTLSREFQDNCPKRDDHQGIYWRINILRNRMAHSTRGAYRNSNVAGRYMDIIPAPLMIIYHDGEVVIDSNLIDLEKNPSIQEMIKDIILQKKYGEDLSNTAVFDLLFPETKAKGHGQKNPQVFYPTYGKFDYNKGYLSISDQMLGLIDRQILIFLKAGLARVDANVGQDKWIYEEGQSVTINELYDSGIAEWRDI